MLAFREVSRRFGSLAAVDDFSHSIPVGTTSVLIGPSGCGKSTLLRLAIGLESADRGSVEVLGQPASPANFLLLRRRIGYVIQEGGLFPHMTALENATLMARYLKWDTHQLDARVSRLADLVQLSMGVLNRYPLELSGGQRQRVGLMRALMLDPDLLLLDEPLGALDPMIRLELQELLRGVFRELGKTVLLVTHDLAEAAYLGSQIVLMRAGRLEQCGTMDDLLRRPATPFVTQFVNAQRAPLQSLAGLQA